MGRKQRRRSERRREPKPSIDKQQRPTALPTDRLNRNFLYALIFLAAVAFLIYSNILHAPFVYDDVTFRDKAYIHVKTVPELFQVLFKKSLGRRIGYFTFAFNFYLGGLNTFGYHLTNVIIHVLNGWLIFWLIAKTLTLSRFAAINLRPDNNKGVEHTSVTGMGWKIAFFATLIWLVHPVQIQAVTYIVQRLASLSAFLFLLSFACYVSGRLRQDRTKYYLYGFGVVAGLLAMGVKENVAVLPFFIFLYELYFFQDSPWEELKKRWSIIVLLVVFFVAAAVVYRGPNFWEAIQEPYTQRDFTMGERLLTEGRVVLYYISLIALPLPSRLNVDYDFSVSTSLFSPFSTLLAVVAIIGLIWFSLANASRRPLLSFSILWFFGNLAIESTIIPLDLVYEHRLYLPSLGPIVAATTFLFQKVSSRNQLIAPIILSLVATTFAYWTYERNEVWTSPVRLWTDNAQKSPGKARVHGNLGKALLDAGRYEEAAVEFEKTLKLDPRLLGAYNNLAVIYIDHLKQYEKAKEYLNAALERNPNKPDLYLNLGVIALNQRQLFEAIPLFTKVLELDPQNHTAHYNLAACYVNLRDFPKAFETLDRGLSYWPASHRLYFLKGRAYQMINKIPEARKALQKAYSLRPDDPEVRHYYGLIK